MMPEFETLEEFAITSKVSGAIVKVRLRRQLNHKPTRFSPAPYFLDLQVGTVHFPYYGVDEQSAHEAATRFLLEHVNGIAPRLH